MARAGGSLASALPSEGIYALVKPLFVFMPSSPSMPTRRHGDVGGVNDTEEDEAANSYEHDNNA